MANWNSGYNFNQLPQSQEHGFAWNSAKYIYYVNVSEVIRCTDNILPMLAKLILSDNSMQALDVIAQAAFYQTTDAFSSVDNASISTLYKILESINISDEFSNLVVKAFLEDNSQVIDEAKQLAEFFANEEINSDDNAEQSALYKILENLDIDDEFLGLIASTLLKENLHVTDESKLLVEILKNETINLNDIAKQTAFLAILEKCGLNELSQYVKALIKSYDTFDVSDTKPKKAISDFLIGTQGNFDKAFDWFYPFEMKVDRGETIIQVMPEAELTTVEMPGADGSIIEDTVYKDRMFQIVSYSQQGLTIAEKEELKARIARILDTTKHQTKKLTIQNRGIMFDVKYDGSANISEGPSYVKASIPLRATPYAYDMFDNELEGKGLIYNDGDTSLGVKNIITGPISNPSFTIGATAYQYNGEVSEGQEFVIDHSMMTCYTQDKSGKKLQNGLADLTGEFIRIPAKTGVVLDAPDETAAHLRTVWKAKVLW